MTKVVESVNPNTDWEEIKEFYFLDSDDDVASVLGEVDDNFLEYMEEGYRLIDIEDCDDEIKVFVKCKDGDPQDILDDTIYISKEDIINWLEANN